MNENEMVRRHERLAAWVAAEFYLPNADPEDVHQEALIGLLKAIRTYDPAQASFSTFAALCIRRRLIDVLQAAHTLRQVPVGAIAEGAEGEDGDWLEALDLVEAPGCDPVDVLTERGEIHRLFSLIRNGMTAVEREALVGMLNGVSYAEMEGVSCSNDVKRVDNALQRARRKLRAAA